MIYIKRTLWLLGYPIIYLVACLLFCVAIVFIGFECLFLYIKNGDIQGCDDCLEWFVKLIEWRIKFIEWYSDIEPKEDEL